MRIRRKITIVLIGLAVLVAVLRESTFWDLNNYKVTSEASATSNLRHESLDASFDSSLLRTKFANNKFSDLPIRVVFDSSILLRDSGNDRSIVIMVDSIDLGFLWIPLYKSTTFTAAASVNYANSLIKTSPAKIHLLQARITGQMKVEGTISIAGPCSHTQAKNLVYELVGEKLAAKAKDYLFNLD